MYITAGFFAFVATILFMLVLRPVAKEIGLIDVPGGRKRHGVEVPLIGGIAMSLAIGLASTLIPQAHLLLPTLLAIYLLVAVGTVDDKFDLPAGLRLVAQGVAAMLVVYGAQIQVSSLEESFFFTLNLGPFAPVFTLLLIITLINAFNVIDGIDGLAGGLSLISLISLAVVGYGCDEFGLAVVGAAAVGGFLLFNLPLGSANRRVRSFMGDAGSTFLGLGVAAIGISITQSGMCEVAPIVGLWIVAVPVYDLFTATIRRVMEGRSPFSPDHEHLHHALIVEGLSPRKTLAVMLSAAVSFAGVGLLGHYMGAHQGLLLVGWLGGLVLYYQAVRRPRIIIRIVDALCTLPRSRAIGP